jgi:hypothetical protein
MNSETHKHLTADATTMSRNRPVPELTPVHKAYKLALSQELVTTSIKKCSRTPTYPIAWIDWSTSGHSWQTTTRSGLSASNEIRTIMVLATCFYSIYTWPFLIPIYFFLSQYRCGLRVPCQAPAFVRCSLLWCLFFLIHRLVLCFFLRRSYANYPRLVMLSFRFQKAFQQGFELDDKVFFTFWAEINANRGFQRAWRAPRLLSRYSSILWFRPVTYITRHYFTHQYFGSNWLHTVGSKTVAMFGSFLVVMI